VTYRIISDPMRVWRFVTTETGVPASSTMKGLGLERDGELVSGVLYEQWNGVNLFMHVALAPGARWTPRYLWYCFHYPFVELGCRRVSGWVEASNAEARRVDENLGFRAEATLTGAAHDGGDVILYVMRQDECRFLKPPKGAASMALLAQQQVMESRHGQEEQQRASA
jgi:hypothetical protein